MGCAWPQGESEKKTLSDRNDRPTSQLLWVEQHVVQGGLMPLVQNIPVFLVWLCLKPQGTPDFI